MRHHFLFVTTVLLSLPINHCSAQESVKHPTLSDILERHRAYCAKIHSLDINLECKLLEDETGPISPPKLLATMQLVHAANEDRVIFNRMDATGRTVVKTIDRLYDQSQGSVWERTLTSETRGGKPLDYDFGLVLPPQPIGSSPRMSHDALPWLLLSVTPLLPPDPRLTLDELVQLSTTPAVLSVTPDTPPQFQIDVSWPKDIPSASMVSGTISVVVSPEKQYAITKLERRYRTFDANIKGAGGESSLSPQTIVHRQRIVRFAKDLKSGVILPTEGESEVENTGIKGRLRELYTVTNYDVNPAQRLKRLGFQFKDATVVQYSGSADGVTPDRWAYWGVDGDRPEKIFDSQGEMLDYGRAKNASERPAVQIDRVKQSRLFWIVAANVIVACAIYMAWRRRAAAGDKFGNK
ncbi:MAG: hypothetical protein V4719_26110 [Planctomycetota bacterium]